jgi:hypothetical protein
MSAPDLDLSQFGMQQNAAPSSLVHEKVASDHMQRQTGQRVRQGMGRDDRET